MQLAPVNPTPVENGVNRALSAQARDLIPLDPWKERPIPLLLLYVILILLHQPPCTRYHSHSARWPDDDEWWWTDCASCSTSIQTATTSESTVVSLE